MSWDYIQVCEMHGHPMANSNGVILEHRLKMAEHLGRMLLPEEIVHHKDEDKTNNAIDNLELTTRKKHASSHAEKPAMVHLTCAACGESFTKRENQIKSKLKAGQRDFYCDRSCMARAFGGGRKKPG